MIRKEPALGFVARTPRERAFLALADVVVERGIGNTTLTAVADRAGCSADTLERDFGDTQALVLATFVAAADRAYETTLEAFESAGGWAEAVHAGLASLLAFLVGSPALTRMCTVEALGIGSSAFELRDEVLDRFTALLEPGYAMSAKPPPTAVSEAIGGGVFEIVRSHALEGRIERLGEALPEMTVLALSPFVGPGMAERIASRPPPLQIR
jgi:AcrR family transcriptional regulator